MVAPRFHPVTGGIETHVRHVGQRAIARGHDVTVHCLRHDDDLPPKDAVDGIAVRRYDPLIEIGYYTTLFDPKIPRDAVVHLHAFAHLTNDRVLAHHDRSRVLLTTHHGVTFPTGPIGGLYHALYRWWHVPKLRDVFRVLTVNSTDRARLVEAGVPGDRVEVVPNGVPDAAFETPKQVPDEGHVLFLGRLHEEKAVDDLLRAVADLDVELVVAGPDAGDRDRLERLAGEIGVDDRVAFRGRVDEPTKRGLLRGAACLALPSRHEGQGIVVLEAWAQATPVVATRTAGVVDVVEDGVDGRLVAPGDVGGLRQAIASLIDDPERAEAMGRRGRDKADERYRWSVLADRVVDLYEAAGQP